MNTNLRISIVIFGLIIFIVGITMGAYSIRNSETVEMKCYDSHNNQIEGLVCKGEKVENKGWVIFIIMLGATVIIIGVLND